MHNVLIRCVKVSGVVEGHVAQVVWFKIFLICSTSTTTVGTVLRGTRCSLVAGLGLVFIGPRCTFLYYVDKNVLLQSERQVLFEFQDLNLTEIFVLSSSKTVHAKVSNRYAQSGAEFERSRKDL